MGQDPEVIRQQIAETRDQMGETVEAIGYKADVKARAKENVQEKVGAVSGRVTAVKEKIVGQAGTIADGTPSGQDLRGAAGDKLGGAKDHIGSAADNAKSTVADGADSAKETARQAASVAQENPLGLAIGAVALGFLGGMLIPATRIENEKIGPLADQLKDQARDAGQDAFERGKHVAEDVAHAAQDAAQQAAHQTQDAAREAAHAAA